MIKDRTNTLLLVKVNKIDLPESVRYTTIADYESYTHLGLWLGSEKIGECISYWCTPTVRHADDNYLDYNFCVKHEIRYKDVDSFIEGARR